MNSSSSHSEATWAAPPGDFPQETGGHQGIGKSEDFDKEPTLKVPYFPLVSFLVAFITIFFFLSQAVELRSAMPGFSLARPAANENARTIGLSNILTTTTNNENTEVTKEEEPIAPPPVVPAPTPCPPSVLTTASHPSTERGAFSGPIDFSEEFLNSEEFRALPVRARRTLLYPNPAFSAGSPLNSSFCRSFHYNTRVSGFTRVQYAALKMETNQWIARSNEAPDFSNAKEVPAELEFSCPLNNDQFNVRPWYSFTSKENPWKPIHLNALSLPAEREVRCTRHLDFAVYSHANLGGLLENFWHTMVTYIFPLHMVLREELDHYQKQRSLLPHSSNNDLLYLQQSLPEYFFITDFPKIMEWHKPEWITRLKDIDWLRSNSSIGLGNLVNFFGGSQRNIHFISRDPLDPAISDKKFREPDDILCVDRLYVRMQDSYDNYQGWCDEGPWNCLDKQHGFREFMTNQWNFLYPNRDYEADYQNALRMAVAVEKPKVHAAIQSSFRLIWISRRFAVNKHIENEDSLIETAENYLRDNYKNHEGLKSCNFTIIPVAFERINEYQQFLVFSRSDFISLFRGAAAANMIYSNEKNFVFLMSFGNFVPFPNMQNGDSGFPMYFWDAPQQNSNPNWTSYPLPLDAFMGAFREAMKKKLGEPQP